MKKVYIVGYNGNMARRYRACLDYLSVEHCGEDIDFQNGEFAKCDGIIIATPTENHVQNMLTFGNCGIPILCEKPISKEFLDIILGNNVQMVNQYAHCGPFPGGITYYNNWNTGKDGLIWDCINIIGLAEGELRLENTSPIWKCMINGKELTLQDVDMSYLKMIDAWVKNPKPNLDYIEKAHAKAKNWIEWLKTNSNGAYIEANNDRHSS